jgi:hypothetical protein
MKACCGGRLSGRRSAGAWTAGEEKPLAKALRHRGLDERRDVLGSGKAPKNKHPLTNEY